MANPEERNWTANIVISFDGPEFLKAWGKDLEDEIRLVLARVDDPNAAATYLNFLYIKAKDWRREFLKNFTK